MKKQELKKLLKPLIKECIKEVIFEDGVLSGVIAEVAQGLSGTPAKTELVSDNSIQISEARQEAINRRKTQLDEQKNKLLKAINQEAYGGVDIFEGTEALSSGGSSKNNLEAPGPLSNTEANDPGVDINGILGIAGDRWAAHLK